MKKVCVRRACVKNNQTKTILNSTRPFSRAKKPKTKQKQEQFLSTVAIPSAPNQFLLCVAFYPYVVPISITREGEQFY